MTDQTLDNTGMDDLLDATLDDLADLPENKPFPVGAHQAKMLLSFPKIEPGKPAKSMVICKFLYTAPLELANSTDTPPNAGDESTLFFNLKKKDGTANTYGQGQLKMCLQVLNQMGIQGATNRETIEMAKAGVDVAIVTGLQVYQGNSNMTLVKIAPDQ
jgi:hypothetical protein